LKQINFIAGGPFAAGGPGQLFPLAPPPLNPTLRSTVTCDKTPTTVTEPLKICCHVIVAQ